MLKSVALALFASASAVLASPAAFGDATITERKCGTVISDEKLAANEAHYLANFVPKAASKLTSEAAAAPTVQVYWHVMSKDSTASGGNIPYALFSLLCKRRQRYSRGRQQGLADCRPDRRPQ